MCDWGVSSTCGFFGGWGSELFPVTSGSLVLHRSLEKASSTLVLSELLSTLWP